MEHMDTDGDAKLHLKRISFVPISNQSSAFHRLYPYSYLLTDSCLFVYKFIPWQTVVCSFLHSLLCMFVCLLARSLSDGRLFGLNWNSLALSRLNFNRSEAKFVSRPFSNARQIHCSELCSEGVETHWSVRSPLTIAQAPPSLIIMPPLLLVKGSPKAQINWDQD